MAEARFELNPTPRLCGRVLPTWRHIENLAELRPAGLRYHQCLPTDTAEEMDVIYDVCAKAGVPCALSEVFAKGSEGGKALAETVLPSWTTRPRSAHL